jgi:hypothetical protein
MKFQLVALILVLGLSYPAMPVSAPLGSQSDCPKVAVEAPTDVEAGEIVIKVKVSELPAESLTYEWTAVNGKLKEGQGTQSVTITNFDLRKKSLTVMVAVGGLPSKCSKTASVTLHGSRDADCDANRN